MTIKLVIKGEPVAQGRPRFARRGNFTSTYDPPKSRAYKQLVAYEAKKQWRGRPLTGAVSVRVKIYRPIQAATSKRQRLLKQAGIIRPTQKPDADNYYKSVSDALTGIVWQDDKQIVEQTCGKWYDDGRSERVEIEVIALEQQTNISSKS